MPGRFGGSPLDYQLVERCDTASSKAQIQLLLSPELGQLDEKDVIDTFLNAIGGGSAGERFMELRWRDGQVVEVVRQRPMQTSSGKILHLHSEKDIQH